MNEDGENDPRVLVRALKKLWYSFGFVAKEFPSTPESKGKPGRRPTSFAAQRYDLIIRFIPELVPSSEFWDENMLTVFSLLARYGRQQVLGIDEDAFEMRELNAIVLAISDRLKSENAFSAQNEEYGV